MILYSFQVLSITQEPKVNFEITYTKIEPIDLFARFFENWYKVEQMIPGLR